MRSSGPVGRIPRGAVLALGLALVLPAGPAHAQEADGDPVDRIVATPAELQLERGEQAELELRALDASGIEVDQPVRLEGPRRALLIQGSRVTAREVGDFELVALAEGEGGEPVTLRIPVTVSWPAVTRLELGSGGQILYEGTALDHELRAYHSDGTERPVPDARWEVSDPEVAQVDAFGILEGRAPGEVTLTAAMDGVEASATYRVEPFPGSELRIRGGESEVRTGDVQRFRAEVLDADGRVVEDVPVSWSHSYQPPRTIRAPGAAALLEEEGPDGARLVAEVPGVFTVSATAGPLAARERFQVVERDVVRSIEILGQGRHAGVRTTDLWVWEGVDGRDYALTGAKMSDGYAFVWDVTDPGAIVKTDSVRVDARSINDVKVSPDGRYATLTREGASDRRNGLVLLDLSVPAHPVVASEVVEGLTGGVHNAYPTNDYAFALSAGEKYVIIDVQDLYNPRYVSEVQHEDCRIHDVWVHDGIAYSAQWACGVIAYDVGHGGWGGTVEEPVFINRYEVPGGRTHAVFPYHQESSDRYYLFIGDEIMSRAGLAWEGVPGNYQTPFDPETGEGGTILSTTGYIQVIDWTDPEEPEMVARYEVPEYGTHNIWVEDDVLYQAYYEGGLRVVDVSGELMGNLYTQGREIAVYKSADPQGWVPNSPMVWSAMPFKGMIFWSDTNSGVWAGRLEPSQPLTP